MGEGVSCFQEIIEMKEKNDTIKWYENDIISVSRCVHDVKLHFQFNHNHNSSKLWSDLVTTL